MRRTDKEITSRDELVKILNSAMVCRLAFQEDECPYIVPLNYGFSWSDELVLYFHGAKEGKKLELLRKNKHVGFEIDVVGELVNKGNPCDWGMKYKSILGKGEVVFLEDDIGKVEALDCIMKHYGYEGKPDYRAGIQSHLCIYKLVVEEFCGKGTKD